MFSISKQENNQKRQVKYSKLSLLVLLFMLTTIQFFGQDSIPAAKDLTEEKELQFQQFFFKALSEKSIGNHQKAIENLESCNQILENDATVFFEFSKNYFELHKMLLAKEYINRALQKEPKNVWMLKHLIKIQIKKREYKEAITNQQKLIEKNIEEKEFLIQLYLYDSDYDKAILLMDEMESKNALSSNLKKLKTNLENRRGKKVVKKNTLLDSTSLKEQFKSNKTYVVLKQILDASINNKEELLRYSAEGIALFPAQPYVYLVQAKALNDQKKYQKALLVLQSGIDFVIEDDMEASFYKEMAISYKGLGKLEEEKKFLEKSKKVKS